MDLDTLIRRAKKKDPDALDTIYRTYYPQMVGVCMNIIREDRATVDDLVHDAFILAFVSIGNLRDNSKINEWLTSIVRNVSLKHIEQRERVHTLPISSIKEEDAVFVDSASSPDEDLNYKELLALIDQLPEGYSKILRLSVIEGFSHKEIAEMLGIKPHSSSSQLARAKIVLKHLLDNKAIGIIAVLLLIAPIWYFIFNHEDKRQNEIVKVDEHDRQLNPNNEHIQAEQIDTITEKGNSAILSPVINISTNHKKEIALTDKVATQVVLSDSDSIATEPHSEIHNEVLVTETVEDSTVSVKKDSIIAPVIIPELNITEELGKQKKKWQFLAAGSLGPALAQGAYKILATNSGIPEIDPAAPEPDYVVPDNVSTWEDYGKYLRFVSSPDASADTLALIEIADHNTGEIEQKEHHDKPITIGISLTKSLGRNWSLETGLQYSILKSQFYMGENGYSIVDKQKVHYLGIPLRVSYNWIDYKRLSAYTSAGVALHIPVYGKVSSNYLVNWQSAYSESRHFTPSLQWQTGVGIGLQYKLAPNTSLFVEPTFNWFIPSGSDTHTIWTEHPFMFTCPFGLRITW